MSIQSSAESRRERMFAWNREHAKWGLFGTSVPEFAGPPLCGVCGDIYDDQQAKADHLVHVHGATVTIVSDGRLYEWRRP
jgi:hypothetical protein